MTAQILEKLIYRGQTHGMASEPLKAYLDQTGVEIHSLNPSDTWVYSTALSRGYVGTWEVMDDHLYLVNLVGCDDDATAVAWDSYSRGGAPEFLPNGSLVKFEYH